MNFKKEKKLKFCHALTNFIKNALISGWKRMLHVQFAEMILKKDLKINDL